MFARLARLLVGHPWPILTLLVIVTAAAGLIAARIDFDFTPQSIFAGDDDLVTYAEDLKETFGYEDAMLMVVIESTGDDDVLDQSALNWQGEIARRLEELPRVVNVRSLATLEVPQIEFGDGVSFKPAPVIREFPVSRAEEGRVRRLFDRSKLIEGAMLSADRRVGTILIMLDPAARDVDSMRESLRNVDEALRATPPPEGYRLHISGLPAIRVDVVDQLMADQRLLFPMAAGLFLFALAFVFRNVSGAVLPLVAVGIGLVWTIAAIVLAGESFNIISNILPILLLIIGISNCVHIVTRYAEEAEWVPGDRKEVARRTIARMAVACILTFGTTAIGFGSLIAARSNLLRSFGWEAALGMVLLYISVIVTFGTLFAFFRPPRHRESSDHAMITEAVDAAGRAVARHPRVTLLVAAGVVMAAFFAARNITVNSFIIETYEEDHSTIRTIRLVERELSGLLPLEISLRAERPGQFLEPETYHRVAAITKYADDMEAVTFARSYVDLHQEVYANFRRDDALRDELPPLDEEGAERIRRSRSLIRDAGETVQYDAFVNDAGTRARVLLRVRDIGTRDMLTLIDDLESQLTRVFPPGSGITPRLTGDAYLNARAMDSFVRDLFSSLLGASVVIFGFIAALFRSMRIGLIAMIPNLTPLAVTLGYMGLRGYDMNAGNVVVFAISLGIAVDNTIHFITRFREELALIDDVPEAVQRTCHGSGRAIVLTTVFIVSGLAVLLLSDFVPTRRFAELTSITMFAALFGDLLLLPASLVMFWKPPRPQPELAADVTDPGALPSRG